MHQRLSSSLFQWENYLSPMGLSLMDVVNPSFNLLPGVEFVGSCCARSLYVRPKLEGWAWLVRVDGVEVWFHSDSEFPA